MEKKEKKACDFCSCKLEKKTINKKYKYFEIRNIFTEKCPICKKIYINSEIKLKIKKILDGHGQRPFVIYKLS